MSNSKRIHDFAQAVRKIVLAGFILFVFSIRAVGQQAAADTALFLPDLSDPRLKTAPSYFTSENSASLFFSLAKPGGEAGPFFRDKGEAFLRWAGTAKRTVLTGEEADKSWRGKKITWGKKISGCIWVDSNCITTSVKYWHEIDANYDDCRNGPVVPFVRMEVSALSTEQAPVISWYPVLLAKKKKQMKGMAAAKSKSLLLQGKNSRTITAKMIDLNADNQPDLLWYAYKTGPEGTITRACLLVNINGSWSLSFSTEERECP